VHNLHIATEEAFSNPVVHIGFELLFPLPGKPKQKEPPTMKLLLALFGILILLLGVPVVTGILSTMCFGMHEMLPPTQ
jgi:hypothetical protein